MSAATVGPARSVSHSPGTAAGTAALLRFMLRRDRIRLPVWLAGSALLLGVQAVQSQRIYDTPEDLANLRESVAGNAAVLAISGPEQLLATIGGEVVFEIFAYLAIVAALMNMFTVGRHTRADEEEGRTELLRAAAIGRHAPLTAVLLLTLALNATLAVLLFVVAAGTGLPVTGSLLLGLAVGALGMAFAALTAAAAQVFPNVRAVYGAGALALGAAYALRAAGDAGDGTLAWASPIGWGQQTLPYVADRWWPLLLPSAAALAAIAMALLVLNRRDFGAGLLATRLGRPSAARSLGSPIGLAWRLHRAALGGWTVGLLLLGAAYGSIGDTIEEWVEDNPDIAEFLPGGPEDVVDAYLGLTITTLVLLGTAFGVSAVLHLRREETSGRAEPILAAAVGRGSWLAGNLTVALAGATVVVAAAGVGEGLAYGLTVSDAGEVPRLTAAALTYLPAAWLAIAVAACLLGWWPRLAAPAAWSVLGFAGAITLLGDSLDLPGWLRGLSPIHHIPQVPLEDPAPTPLVVLGALAAALVATGAAGLRRRDLGH